MSDEKPQGTVHRDATRVMSVLMLVIGIVLVVSTIARGGGPIALGVLLGILFVLVGAGRLYIANKGI